MVSCVHDPSQVFNRNPDYAWKVDRVHCAALGIMNALGPVSCCGIMSEESLKKPH